MIVRLKPIDRIYPHHLRISHRVNSSIFGTKVEIYYNDTYNVARSIGYGYYTVVNGEAILLREDWFVSVVDDVQEMFNDMIEGL